MKNPKFKNKKRFYHRLSSYLMFKQGLKGVFYYKLQLIIIITLTFFATLLLSVGMSTDKRLNNDFNNYVNNSQRFNTTYQYRVNNAASKVILHYFPTADLQPAYTVYGSPKGKNPRNVSDYNILFNSNKYNDNYGMPFDLFTSATGQTAFGSLIKIAAPSLVKVTFTPGKKTITYNPSIGSSKTLEGVFNKNVNNYLLALQQSSVGKKLSDIKTSLIGYDFLHFLQTNSAPSISAVSDFVHQIGISYYLSALYNYFYSWFRSRITNYFQYFVSRAITDAKNNLENINTAAELQTFLNNDLQDPSLFQNQLADFAVLVNSSPSLDAVNRITALAYEYMMGSRMDSGTIYDFPDKNFIGSYIQNVQKQTPTTNNTLSALGESIYRSGFRGVASPIVNLSPQGQAISSTSAYGLSSTLLIKEPFQLFNQGISHQPEKQFLFHQQLAANVAGFKINFRNEVFSFNNATKRSTRFVILQNDPTDGYDFFHVNLHIIKGTAPFLNNQVVVSPQYARANRVDVGDVISINGISVYVSGYGTDPYSFIPNASQQGILPNVEDSAVIYGSNDLRDVIANATSSVNQDYTNVFLTHQNMDLFGNRSVGFDNDLYASLLLSGVNNVFESVNFFTNPFPKNDIPSSQTTNLSFQNFNKSNYHYNWTLLPLALRIFVIVTFVSSGILFLIAIAAIVISIHKTIKRQASQIAILKAMGCSNQVISFSYLMYAFLIIAFVIPLGWLFGILVQWPTSEVFQTFFSLNYLQIVFDWRPLLIAMAVFGSLSIIVSVIAAYQILRKNVADIIRPGSYYKNNRLLVWAKSTIFRNTKFLTRFRLSVTSTSVRSIGVFSVVIFIASMLITVSLALPSFIANISNSYFKDLKYKNSFQLDSPVFNSPLSKSSSSYWEGPYALEKQWSQQGSFNPDGSATPVPGYRNFALYNQSMSNVSAIPTFLYQGKQPFTPKAEAAGDWGWTGDLFAKDFLQALGTLEGMFGNNIALAVGHGFNLGVIDGLIAATYHSTNFKDGQGNLNLAKRINALSNINNTFNTGLGSIIAQIFGKPIGQGPWRQQIIDQLLNETPPFVSNYVNSTSSRQEQFGFGWSYTQAATGADTETTTIPTLLGDNNLPLTGVSPTSQIVQFPKSGKQKLLVPISAINTLTDYLHDYAINKPTAPAGNIEADGIQIYNKSTNTLTIPVYANEQAAAQLRYRGNNLYTANVLPQENVYQFLNQAKQWQLLPKNWWSYDDSDFVNSQIIAGKQIPAGYKQKYLEENFHYYLNPFTIPDSEFTYNEQYNQNGDNRGKIAQNAYGFVDNYFPVNRPNEKMPAPFVRPWFELSNLHLYVPANLVNTSFLDPANLNSPNLQTKVYTKVNAAQVPSSVTSGYPSVTEWYKFTPYSFFYDPRYTPEDAKAPLGNLLNKYASWIRSSLVNPRQATLRVEPINNSIPAAQSKTITSPLYPKLNIRYVVRGTVQTYDSATLFADEQLVNAILGYSQARNYHFTFNRITENNPSKTGFQFMNPNVEQVVKDSKDNNFVFKNESQAPLMWYNSIYSRFTEPTPITTFYADGQDKFTGAYFTNNATDTLYNHGNLVSNVNLLSTKELLVNRLTAVCLSVAVVVIIFIIVCAILLILLISNLFVAEYERFMVLMKTDGYTTGQIVRNTINIYSIYVLMAWGAGAALGWLGLYLFHNYAFSVLGIALPFALAWWAFLVSFVLVGLMYTSVYLLTLHKIRGNTVELLRDTQRRL